MHFAPDLKSIRKLHSSLGTSSLQNFSSIGGSHSFTETVNLLSLSLFGLIGSQHIGTSFSNCSLRRFLRSHTSHVSLYYKNSGVVKGFWEFLFPFLRGNHNIWHDDV